MTHDQAMKRIEAYYGPYPRNQAFLKKMVFDWLKAKIGEKHLNIFLQRVFTQISIEYNNRPCVAQLEKILGEMAKDGSFRANLQRLEQDLDRTALEERPESERVEVEKMLKGKSAMEYILDEARRKSDAARAD